MVRLASVLALASISLLVSASPTFVARSPVSDIVTCIDNITVKLEKLVADTEAFPDNGTEQDAKVRWAFFAQNTRVACTWIRTETRRRRRRRL